jgi:hypothetical protein
MMLGQVCAASFGLPPTVRGESVDEIGSLGAWLPPQTAGLGRMPVETHPSEPIGGGGQQL